MWKFIVTSVLVEPSCCSLLTEAERYEESRRNLTDIHRGVFVNEMHTDFLCFKIKGKLNSLFCQS